MQAPARLYYLAKTAATLLAFLCQAADAQSWFENFDGEGDSVQNSLFPDIYASGGATFRRESLTGVPGAPNTSPELSLNQGGDKELRYFEDGSPAYYSAVALTAPTTENSFLNGNIEGYVGFGVGSGFGSRSVGLILRATTPQDYYVASVGANMNLTGGAVLQLAPVSGGIVGYGPSVRFPDLDFTRHAYRLSFDASDALLTASLYEQSAWDGVLSERFLASVAAQGSQIPGRAGLYTFVRGDNSALFDDVTITVPEPGTISLALLGIIAVARARRRLKCPDPWSRFIGHRGAAGMIGKGRRKGVNP